MESCTWHNIHNNNKQGIVMMMLMVVIIIIIEIKTISHNQAQTDVYSVFRQWPFWKSILFLSSPPCLQTLLSLPPLFLAVHNVTGVEHAFGHLGSFGLAVFPLNSLAIPTPLIGGREGGEMRKAWHCGGTVQQQPSTGVLWAVL